MIGRELRDGPHSCYTQPRGHEGPRKFEWMKILHGILHDQYQVNNISWSTKLCNFNEQRINQEHMIIELWSHGVHQAHCIHGRDILVVKP